MSWQPAEFPNAVDEEGLPVDLVVVPRAHDIGGLEVRRALPTARRRMVGPFIFFDQMGPATVAGGRGARRAAASPYRAGDGHLPVRGRDHAPRQPRHRAADPPGRGQLDDRRPRHRALRTVADTTLRAEARRDMLRHPGSGWRCRRRHEEADPEFFALSRLRGTANASRMRGQAGAGDRSARCGARPRPAGDVFPRRSTPTPSWRPAPCCRSTCRARGARGLPDRRGARCRDRRRPLRLRPASS